MVMEFEADRTRAKEALLLSQVYQQRAYNKGRLITEFKEGDLVVLNAHSLRLLRSETGRGQKLLMRYDGPFEILRKLSPVTYQLCMPASYGTHPIINIAHLEPYQQSPPEFGLRPTKDLNRDDFDAVPEHEVDAIVGERFRKVRNGRRVREYKTRFTGFGPESDEWLPASNLKNAPLILKAWRNRQLQRDHLLSRTVDVISRNSPPQDHAGQDRNPATTPFTKSQTQRNVKSKDDNAESWAPPATNSAQKTKIM